MMSAFKVEGTEMTVRNNTEASRISFLFTAESPFQGELRRDNVRKESVRPRLGRNFQISKNVTSMTLFSAQEDLQETTLKSISGFLRRLQYVAGLRDKEGRCAHWGLVRVYGETASNRALAEVHGQTLSRVLSTPIQSLETDLQTSSEHAGIAESAYLEELSQSSARLLPPAPGAGSGRHLSSVLHALSSLRKARRPDASPRV